MTVQTTTPVVTIPLQIGGVQQPIQIVADITHRKEKKDDVPPGYRTYWAIEAFMHYAMINQTVAGCESDCTPIYKTTYLVAATAGALYGVYCAKNGKGIKSIHKNAEGFAEANLFGGKVWSVAEQILFKTVALNIAEGIELAPGLTAGSLVAGFWGFSLGSEVASNLYKNFASKKAE